METAGAKLTSIEIAQLLKLERVLGLGEVMDYSGVVSGSKQLLRKLLVARQARRCIDGHAPGLGGYLLQAYIAAGIGSDHECIKLDEALEKLRAGMFIMIREGSAAKNLIALLPAITDLNLRRFCLVTDDKHPDELLRDGYLDAILRKTVTCGVDPAAAIQMVTINPAEHYGVVKRGAIAPGYLADLVILKDLTGFKIRMVFKAGVLVAKDGEILVKIGIVRDKRVVNTIKIPRLTSDSFAIKATSDLCRVIELVPDQIVTKQKLVKPTVEKGYVKADPIRDILKLAVIERHFATGRIGLGLVSGFGLNEGAIGSTVAHDSHNIIIAGTNYLDMLKAAKVLQRMGGGYVAIASGEVAASLRLPIAGLMSLDKAERVVTDHTKLLEKAHEWGSKVNNPFITLSFLALPVIPELKLTDKGLVDVVNFKIVSLFVKDQVMRDRCTLRGVHQGSRKRRTDNESACCFETCRLIPGIMQTCNFSNAPLSLYARLSQLDNMVP